MLRAFLLIVVGLAGDPEHGELFRGWGSKLADAAGQLGVAAEHVILLTDQQAPAEETVSGRATRDGIARAFDTLARTAAEDDLVMVVLIGHGTFDGRVAKFNLPGPDMTAADFGAHLRRLKSKHVVFVNTASASGPFVPELAAPGRTIITATRSGAEQFDTLFGGYFVDALTADTADADKNRRVTLLEAFEHARAEVARAYEREGLLATEHALLDDDGDGKGSEKPGPTGADGKVAALLTLGSPSAGELPADPRLRALHQERREMELRIEALKLLKPSMDQERYLSELEKLAVALAAKTREIRQLEGKPQ